MTEESERTRWMGMIGASYAVGFLVGPALGGLLSPVETDAGLRFTLLGSAVGEVLSPLGYGIPMLAAAGLAAANLVYAALVLREPERHQARGAVSERRADVLRDPRVRRLCAIYLLFTLAVAQLETLFQFVMADRFAYGARDAAWVLVGMAVLSGAIQGGGMRALSGRFGERALVTTGIGLLAVGMAGVPFAAPVAVLLLPLALCAVGRAVSQPALLGLVSIASNQANRGAVMGTFQASASLARVLGPLAAGALYDLALPVPFLLASALLVTAAGLGAQLGRAAGPSAAQVPRA